MPPLLVEEDPEKKTGKEVLDALIVPRQSDLKFAKEESCFSVQTLILPWVNSRRLSNHFTTATAAKTSLGK